MGGIDSGQWFAQVRQLMLKWFPEPEDVIIDGAGHDLTLTHPGRLAEVVVDFIERHPQLSPG